ncbi:DUF1598 domain-containing protein [Stratiformator vulcanicus]|uniref:DUF1598 domain-containing protein n=1 Tax=Stratiformator vulcanicus TaxID=2527980 RepID=A0A517QWE3_9PLAN|nr:DUF1598 domain-containing protein [Stratiformator vulcanicus]QDT35890.1 hypothetical protein Pan189_02430 [Stratiformator vulcanicus]
MPSSRSSRTRSAGGGYVAAAAVVFAVAAVAFYWNANGRTVADSDSSDSTSGQVVANKPAVTSEADGAPVIPATKADAPAETVVDGSVAIQEVAETALTEEVAEHLVAGEYGRAMAIAESADVSEREQLTRQIAQAMLDAGEFQNRRAALRRLIEPQESQDGTLAGGASVANFAELLALIQQNTAGPWMAVDGIGGSIAQYTNGVHVDPMGRLTTLTRQEQTDRLSKLAYEARQADLNDDMAASSPFRIVSLVRLEREVAQRLGEGRPVPQTMQQLAGITSVRYVFVDEARGDVMLGGPAEGWKYDETGRAIGLESNQPTLKLDDLVVAMRTFAPTGLGAFQCLIVPRQDNLAAVRDFVAESQSRGSLSSGAGTRNFVDRIEELLGEQDVVVNGVPLDSRIAQVIVEADYRMKLIGIDDLEAGGIPSYFDLLTGEDAANEPMKALRWWLTVNYDSVMHDAGRSVFEFVGSAVRCQSEDEFIAEDGSRIHTGQAGEYNRAFAERFTALYDALSAEEPVFADLRNIFDLSIASAVIEREGLADRAAWDRGVFANGGAYEPLTYASPKTVPSAVNHRVYPGGEVVVQAAGGVQGDVTKILADSSIMQESGRLATIPQAAADDAPAERWWWDVK